MENTHVEKITKKLIDTSSDPVKLLSLVVGTALVLGVVSGVIMARSGGKSGLAVPSVATAPKSAQQDTKTFRDFAEGVIKVKSQPKNPAEYTEGTHILEREGAVPVALTSSVVDLSQYEGKKVKVYGETQKALKEGWLMDVGKVEEVK